ncbi:MAG TPA: DTW domain-containing protein [Polyangiaceae bacterium]|nr:DTW domain-containing protein [Polyangiaceae bacterium]
MHDSTEFQPRWVCPGCRRPRVTCYCSELRTIQTRTRVLLLQHPRERDMPIGTARMAHLSLPNSELLVGFDWQNSPALWRELNNPAQPAVLLYPGENAIDLSRERMPGPVTLVVVDGTWSNTKKMVAKNPCLAALPRVAFQPPRPSEYRIRREPRVDFVSTIEALMFALGALEEEPRRFEALLLPFRKLIDSQIECATKNKTPRRRRAVRRKSEPRKLPECLWERPEDLVCVVGEANAWPVREATQRSAYPDELIQWVALRPSTGESFQALAAPRNPLAPSTASHLELPADELLRARELPELMRGFREFLRPNDVLCAWGCYSLALYCGAGGALTEPSLDLRAISKAAMRQPVGTLEDFAASLSVSARAPLGTGRARRRVVELGRVVEFLASGGGS